MAIEVAHRYEQISAKAYEHPADRAATSALHAVPLLDKVIERLTDLGHERRLRQIVMENAVRIGDGQMPALWGDYTRCASVLDLPTVPDLYVTNDPMVNAMTIGAKTPIVIVKSSLVGWYEANETETVLAHELGHVLSEHYYYTTALILLSSVHPRACALEGPCCSVYPCGACTSPLPEWARAVELSADRAAVLVMADPLEPGRRPDAGCRWRTAGDELRCVPPAGCGVRQ